jgi:iron complex outermembrane receptor protein
MKSFRIFTVLVMAAAIGLPVYADEPSQKTREALKQEFEWLKAEAAATVTVATKTKMNIDDAPSIVSVVTEDQIKNSGAKNLSEVLRQVAGFNVYQNPSYPDDVISIRGLGGAGNASFKIMVNGHSVDNPYNPNNDIVFSFPVNLIKKIEIIRGPGSALYGNSAMNGVINIITKDAKNPSAISAEYGSFGTHGGTGQVSYSKNDFSMFLFGDAVKTDGDPQLIGKDAASFMFPPGHSLAPGYSNEDFQLYNFFTKFAYKDFYLTGMYSGGHRENPVGITNMLTDDNDIRNKYAFAEAGYESALTDKIRLSAKVYYDYLDFDVVYEGFSQKTTSLFGFPAGEGALTNAGLRSRKIGTEMMLTVTPVNSLELISGVSYEYGEDYALKYFLNGNVIGKPMTINGITYPMFGYFNGFPEVSGQYPWMESNINRTIYAGYVQGTWNMTEAFPALKQIGKNLSVTAGLRYDNYDDVGDTLNPRLGLVYAPNETLFFKLLYGQAFRAPMFGEMYLRNNPAIIGNPDMKPETISTAEFLAGIHLNEHITATLDFFNIRKEDTIRLYQGKYANWGEIESQGVEGEIRVSFDKHKYGYFNVTFQKAKDVTHETIIDLSGTSYTQEDFDLGSYPQVMANLGVNSDISRYINANVSVNYIGSMERIGKMQFTASKTDADGTVQKSDQRDPVGSYALFNLSLIFHNFDFAKGWELQLTGYNLFNADQRDPDTSGQIPNDLPRWGRNFMGKLTYTF